MPGLRSVGVAGGPGGVGAAAGGGPCHVAGLGLGECPAGGLLEVMVVPADGTKIAFTGPPAEVVGDRMIQIAGGGGAAAAGPRTGRLPYFDDVAEGLGGLVAAGFPGVGAVPGLQWGDLHGPDPSGVCGRPRPEI